MATYHLRYWSKAHGRTSNPLIPALSISRIYVNADDGSTLGYIERRLTAGERGRSSDYDRHRAAKGDTAETTGDDVTVHLPEGALDAIKAAVIAADPEQERAMFDDVGAFLAIQTYARGCNWIASSAKRERELKRLAQAFVVEI